MALLISVAAAVLAVLVAALIPMGRCYDKSAAEQEGSPGCQGNGLPLGLEPVPIPEL